MKKGSKRSRCLVSETKESVHSSKKLKEELKEEDGNKKNRDRQGNRREKVISKRNSNGLQIDSGLSVARYRAALNNLKSIIGDIAKMLKESEKKLVEYAATKINLKYLNSIEAVLEVYNELDSKLVTLINYMANARKEIIENIEEFYKFFNDIEIKKEKEEGYFKIKEETESGGLKIKEEAEFGGLKIKEKKELGGLKIEKEKELGGLKIEEVKELGGLKIEKEKELGGLKIKEEAELGNVEKVEDSEKAMNSISCERKIKSEESLEFKLEEYLEDGSITTASQLSSFP